MLGGEGRAIAPSPFAHHPLNGSTDHSATVTNIIGVVWGCYSINILACEIKMSKFANK
jgi:hypothetical protein